MQDIVISRQLVTVLWALLFGAGCAAAYDGVRFFREFLFGDGRGSVTGANVLDLIYFVALGCAFSVFLFIANSGRFRWYLLFGAAAGFFLYRVSVGRLVKLILSRTAQLLRRAAGAVLRVIAFPARAVCKILKRTAGGIASRLKHKKEEKEKLRREKLLRSGRRRPS